MEYKSNNNVVFSCKYHVVFCPKYRRSVLVNGVDIRLKEIIGEVAQEFCVEVIEMEIMPDHVHLLLEVDLQFGIHKAVKRIKGRSSRILREEFPWLGETMNNHVCPEFPSRASALSNLTHARLCARSVFKHICSTRKILA